MYWHLKEGAEAPGPDPADVWLGYSGVWHFAEEVSAEQAGIVRAADSTGKGNEGIPETGSKGNITHMISVEGVKQNYWIVEPSLTKTAWESSAAPEERGQVDLGQPAIVSVAYVCHELFSDRLTITNDLQTVDENGIDVKMKGGKR